MQLIVLSKFKRRILKANRVISQKQAFWIIQFLASSPIQPIHFWKSLREHVCVDVLLAPLVQSVVCLDATVPMLEVGQLEAQRCQLHNITFVKGYAEELPFLGQQLFCCILTISFSSLYKCHRRLR